MVMIVILFFRSETKTEQSYAAATLNEQAKNILSKDPRTTLLPAHSQNMNPVSQTSLKRQYQKVMPQDKDTIHYNTNHKKQKKTHKMNKINEATACASQPSEEHNESFAVDRFRPLEDGTCLFGTNYKTMNVPTAFEVKSSHPNEEDQEAFSKLTAARFKWLMENNKKRKAAESRIVTQMPRTFDITSVLAKMGINYDTPLNPMMICLNRSKQCVKEQVDDQHEIVHQ